MRRRGRPGSPSSWWAAGPTGVEMAGQIGELARDTLRREFREMDPRRGEDSAGRDGRPGADELPAEALGEGRTLARAPRRHAAARPHGGGDRRARRDDRGRGARPGAHSRPDGDLGGRRDGLLAGPEPRRRRRGWSVDRAGRARWRPTSPCRAIRRCSRSGDMVRVLDEDGEPQQLLGVAPVAMQQGRYAAKVVKARLRGRRARAVPVPRQGQRRDHRPCSRGRRRQGPAGERLPGLVPLARGSTSGT